jgi:hypothetical protein
LAAQAQEASPCELVEFAGQGEQAAAPAAANVFGAQGGQPSATEPKEPAPQRVHCSAKVAPTKGVVVPPGHEAQLAPEKNEPRPQFEQKLPMALGGQETWHGASARPRYCVLAGADASRIGAPAVAPALTRKTSVKVAK